MKTLKYGYLGEDEAQKIFLKNYLNKVSNSEISFQIDEYFPLKATDRAQVRKRFKEAIQVGITQFKQDVFFVGIDLDNFENSKRDNLFSEMKSEIHPQFQSKTCIFIPVQAIEYWLWYFKLQKKNPSSTKSIQLEKKTRIDAKIAMYGFKKVSNEKSNPIVEEFSENLDINFLESRSESFRHFNKQVNDFIAKQLL